jgi:ATP-dependent RNA helicase SUPV3L1/SUV3
VLVASDAIGMGLNLNIKRVIFSETSKYDGESVRPLLPTEVKQIGGRAGRFQSRFPTGRVTCFGSNADLRFLGDALGAELEPLSACGLLPTAEQLEGFARSGGESLKFSKLLRLFFETTRTDTGHYFVCSVDELYRTARLLDPIDLTIADRLDFCIAPVDTSDTRIAGAFFAYAKAYANAAPVRVGVRAPRGIVPRSDREISVLEGTHAILDVYLWLSQKFGEAAFVERDHAQRARNAVGELISEGLAGRLVAARTAEVAGRGGARGGSLKDYGASSARSGHGRRPTKEGGKPAAAVVTEASAEERRATRRKRRLAKQVLRSLPLKSE